MLGNIHNDAEHVDLGDAEQRRGAGRGNQGADIEVANGDDSGKGRGDFLVLLKLQ